MLMEKVAPGTQTGHIGVTLQTQTMPSFLSQIINLTMLLTEGNKTETASRLRHNETSRLKTLQNKLAAIAKKQHILSSGFSVPLVILINIPENSDYNSNSRQMQVVLHIFPQILSSDFCLGCIRQDRIRL